MVFFAQMKINRLVKRGKAMQQKRVHSQPTDVELKNEILIYHKLAGLAKAVEGKRKFPFARDLLELAYRTAASLDDAKAQYLIGKYFLEEAKYRDTYQQNGVFASNANSFWIKRLYEEAHAFLKAADDRKHVQAKRLRGLAQINGWGIPANKDEGFGLVLDSIDAEGSWDRVPEIFKQIGLNKPEFFSALAAHRKDKG